VRKGRFASCARFVAWGYVGALVALAIAFRFVGEDAWIVTGLMYLPRALFALPLVFTLPAAVYAGPRWLLATQVAAGLIVLFPLMGLELHPFAPRAAPASAKIRLLSYNVYFGNMGCDAIGREIASHAPDVVLLQAGGRRCVRAIAAQDPSFHVQADREFALATRFTVRDVYHPPDLAGPPAIPARFVRYTLETPIGVVDLYGVHPYSPRHAFEAVRGQVLGDPDDEPRAPEGGTVNVNASTRERQIAAVAGAAASSTNPVVVAGDTNLPGLSRVYAKYLGSGSLSDGFAAVGNGFGYTFPARWKLHLGPWMRIDRILAGPELRFLRFEVGGRDASDHCPVIADIAAR
jgi:endonuclease/exonuclease/phosphatase (EEP) superfamily protein YafD